MDLGGGRRITSNTGYKKVEAICRPSLLVSMITCQSASLPPWGQQTLLIDLTVVLGLSRCSSTKLVMDYHIKKLTIYPYPQNLPDTSIIVIGSWLSPQMHHHKVHSEAIYTVQYISVRVFCTPKQNTVDSAHTPCSVAHSKGRGEQRAMGDNISHKGSIYNRGERQREGRDER